MSKRLILILALLFVAGLTCAAYAEVQNVKVSGDLNAMAVSRRMTLKDHKRVTTGSNASSSFLASIARVKIDADLTDNVMTTVRLLNERYWGSETENAGTSGVNTNIVLDLANVTLKEFLYSPLTLTVGRQEFHFGNDMIIGDYNTNNQASAASPFGGTANDPDLSARKAFDGVRATLNYDPLIIDAIYAKVTEGAKNVMNDDVSLYGVNAGYNIGNLKYANNSLAEAYWFTKHSGRKAGINNTTNKADIVNTVGARISTQPIENLTYQLEAALQFGRFVPPTTGLYTATPQNAARRSWALETSLNYLFKQVMTTPSATLGYAYFEGEKDNYNTSMHKHYQGWDPMYENQKFGDIFNALFDQTNLHIAYLGLSAKPIDDVTLKGQYYAYWWDKPFTDGGTLGYAGLAGDRRGDTLAMTGNRFAGQEMDATITYDYTEDVQFSLLGGLYVPGDAFTKANKSNATEVIGSMKVTF